MKGSVLAVALGGCFAMGACKPGVPPLTVQGITVGCDLTLNRDSLVAFAQTRLRYRGLGHQNGGGHRANLRLETRGPARLGPANATVWPVVNGHNSSDPDGRIIARVWIDPTFQDAASPTGTGLRGYFPLDLPPDTSWVMICKDPTTPTGWTSLIIPFLRSEALRLHQPTDVLVGDGKKHAEARWQASSQEHLCVSCKRYGWCELQD